jgi:hypothetical protein
MQEVGIWDTQNIGNAMPNNIPAIGEIANAANGISKVAIHETEKSQNGIATSFFIRNGFDTPKLASAFGFEVMRNGEYLYSQEP